MAPKKALKKVPAGAPKALLAIVADPHCHNHARNGGEMHAGLNRRGRETLATLKAAVARARELGCAMFAVAGDLSHVRRPEPAIIEGIQKALAYGTSEDPLHSQSVTANLIIPGNHDCGDASAISNTACGPLWREAYVANRSTVYEVADHQVIAIPFDNTQPMANFLRGELQLLADDKEFKPGATLITHVGVWDEKDAPPWMRTARDGISAERLLAIMKKHGIEKAFVGNYHEHRSWIADDNRLIIQVGTLCPNGWGDAGTRMRGMMAVLWSDGMVRFEEIPGPRFVTDTVHGLEVSEGCSLYVRSRKTDFPVGGNVVAHEVVGEDVPSTIASGAQTPKTVQEPELVLRQLPDWYEGPAPKEALRDLVLKCWKEAS